MTIEVRVLSASALAEMRKVQMESARAAAAGNRAAGSIGAMSRQSSYGLPFLSKWGNQVQWAGRQLQYNFTLPIALATGAAATFALENEKAFTRVAKVYGDNSKQFNRLAETELPALQNAFKALSNEFGVHQKEVIDIAADWAAAGASGIALAKSVKLTLETMILGEIEAKEATEALIAIQAQFGLQVDSNRGKVTDLSSVIDTLNMVENQTGISMLGLIQGMSRAAGVARVAGVDVEHLAAMMAALVPATGSAASAGNGLKTMISRVLSPTREALDVFTEMGLEVDSLGWHSLNATQRLELLAREVNNASDAQKAHIATVAASRWQINRFVVLMQDITNENGYYQKSLESAKDEVRNFTQRQKELRKVLESNPQRLKQTWIILQNALADVITPLLPAIVYVASEIARLADWFSNLNPEVQKLVLVGLLLLAVIGPIARYVGSLVTLFGLLSAVVHFAGKNFLFFLRPLAAIGIMFGLVGKRVTDADGTVHRAQSRIVTAFKAILSGAWKMALGIPAALLLFKKGFWLAVTWVVTAGAAMAAAFKKALFAIQVTSMTFFPAMLGIWRGFTMGVHSFMTATALGVTAIWGVMTRSLVAIWAGGGSALLAFVARWGKFLISWPALIGTAILGLSYKFREEIASVWEGLVSRVTDANAWSGVVSFYHSVTDGIVDAFWKLPENVRNVLITVVTFVRDAALQVYEWLSYLNPFARHSPSLVDSVTAGMNEIQNQYARAANVGSAFAKAARDLAIFRNIANSMGKGEWQEERVDVAKGYRKALPVFDALRNDLNALTPIMNRQAAAVAKQEQVVNGWQIALDNANRALDIQQNKLDGLQSQLDDVQAAFDAHRDAMQNYAAAPLRGMGAMEDQIFANQHAQNQLRLEMLRWEQVNGPIEETRSQLDALRGEIEVLRGQAASLRAAGAGGEILAPIEAEIAKMEAAAAAMSGTINTSPIGQMQTELEKLQRQGEILDLEKAVQFDPMIRQIDKLVNAQKELTFDQIISGVQRERAAMDALQPRIDSLTAAVRRQEAVVKAATAARDQVQDAYDRESSKLDKLNDKYRQTEDVVRDIESALRDMGQAGTDAIQKAKAAADKAKAAKDKAKGAEEYIPVGVRTFRAAEGANFPEVGGRAKIGREGGMADQSKLIDEFTQESARRLGDLFGGFDLFAPLKRQWKRAWGWVKENVAPVVRGVIDGVQEQLGRIPNPFKGKLEGSWVDGLQNLFNIVGEITRGIGYAFDEMVKLISPEVKIIWNEIVKAGKRIWNEIGPQLENLIDLFKPWTQAMQNVWKMMKPFVIFLVVVLIGAIKQFAAVIAGVIGPVLNLVINVVKAIIRIFTGMVTAWIGLLTGNKDMLLDGVKDIFGGMWDLIISIIKGAWQIVQGIVKGVVRGIVGFFRWLYDKLVGHSIVPDIVNGIFAVFKLLFKLPKWIWNNVLKPVFRLFVSLWKDYVKPALRAWWSGIKAVWDTLKKLGGWVWDNVLHPVWKKIKKLWDDYVKPGLKAWWSGVKAAWDALKKLAGWIWDNVLHPVWKKVKSLWNDYVKPGLKAWWNNIKTAWSNLKGLAKWVWDNALNPVKNKFKEAWEGIRDWFKNNGDMILTPIKAVVRGVVSAINWIIKGINKLSELPGLDFHIGLIELPKNFAAGGSLPERRVGSGFRTTGARAIVGEGKANYPEYVIPTDPTYRNRARALLASAGERLGAQAPLFAKGGIIGDTIGDIVGGAKNLLKGGRDWMVGNLKTIASRIFGPFKAPAEKLINKINWRYAREPVQWAANKIFSWVTSADKVFYDRASKIKRDDAKKGTWTGEITGSMAAAQAFAKSQAGKPYRWGGVGPDGYDCSGFMSAITNVLRGRNPYSRVGATASFPWPGFKSGRGAFTIGSSPNYGGSGIGHMAGTLGNLNVESRGGNGVVVGARARGYNDQYFTEVAHLTGMAQGGIIRARRGGVAVRLAEGGRDEAVTPLPLNWRRDVRGSGTVHNETHIHITGNLEFPNITSGDDAELFVQNLEILARD